MKGKFIKFAAILGLFPAFAFAFVVQQIQYQGVQRIPLSSVEANNPIKVGEDLTPDLSNQALSDLFKTGYFKNVQFYNQNGTLIVQVEELPTIAAVNIKGNSLIKTAQLTTVLNSVGLQVGNMFNQTLINQIQQSLVTEYNSQGKYAVQVNVDVVPTTDNRVNVDINISEGLDTKIEDINITGNQIFTDKQLIKAIPMSTPNLVSFFTGTDVYSSDKMQKAMQALTDFYLNHGYLDFHVNSAEASLNTTHTKAYVTINVTEGEQYKFTGFGFKGDLILPEADLSKLVKIKVGDMYSKQVLTDAQTAIVDALGDQGYAFVNVNPVPTIDATNRTVFINFYVTPGQKVYINQVEFGGNTVANDSTLRKYMKFAEGSTYSKTKVDESTVALEQLPYTPQVSESTEPVPNSNNQVNVKYNVTEQAANQVSAAIGYGGFYGWIFQTGFNMSDLFGTGNTFGINAQVSRPYQSITANLTQPFFTLSGVSQSEGVYFTRNNASDEGLANFSTNSYGATLGYQIPISTWNSFTFGGGVDHTTLQQPGDSESATVTAFTNQYGEEYNTYSINFGLSRDSTNNPWFPTQGQRAGISANLAVPGSDLTFYQLSADGSIYKGINQYVTVMVGANAAYGGGYGGTAHLPFFRDYYAGGWGTAPGVGTVRGYADGQMGPQDTIICTDSTQCTPGSTSEGQALGGNLLVNANLEFYFPVPFTDNPNIKFISFLDAGNVYQTYSSTTVWSAAGNPNHPNFGNIAYTAGVGVEMHIPYLGSIGFDVAEPINKTPSNTQFFDFTLGTVF